MGRRRRHNQKQTAFDLAIEGRLEQDVEKASQLCSRIA